jgi:hypothetical protein
MSPTPEHLKTLEEIECEGIPGLLEVLREEGINGVRYAYSVHTPRSSVFTRSIT